jgi:hypothetical protein
MKFKKLGKKKFKAYMLLTDYGDGLGLQPYAEMQYTDSSKIFVYLDKKDALEQVGFNVLDVCEIVITYDVKRSSSPPVCE